MSRYRAIYFLLVALYLAAPARGEWTAEQKCLQVISNFQRAVDAVDVEMVYRERVARMAFSGPFLAPVVATVLGRRIASLPCVDSATGAPCSLRSDEYNPFNLAQPAFVQGCGALAPGQVGLVNLGTGDDPRLDRIEIQVCRDLSFEPACRESFQVAALLDASRSWNPEPPHYSSLLDIQCSEALNNATNAAGSLTNLLDELDRYGRAFPPPLTQQDAVDMFLFQRTGHGPCVPLAPPFFDYCANPTPYFNPLNPAQYAYTQGCASVFPGQCGLEAHYPSGDVTAAAIDVCANFGGSACHMPDTLWRSVVTTKD